MYGSVRTKARGRDAMCNDRANPADAIYTADGRKRVKQERLRAESERRKDAGFTRANTFTRTRVGRIKTRHPYVRGMAFADARRCPVEGTPKFEPTLRRPAARPYSRAPPGAWCLPQRTPRPVSVIRRFE